MKAFVLNCLLVLLCLFIFSLFIDSGVKEQLSICEPVDEVIGQSTDEVTKEAWPVANMDESKFTRYSVEELIDRIKANQRERGIIK